MGLRCAARHIGEFLGGSEESHPEVRAIPKNWPVESRARGSYTGAYLLGGVLTALLLLRFVFAP
jgi:hypothetical protein